MLRLGVHLSIARGINHLIEEIEKFGINTFQIFLRNPRGYNCRRFNPKEVEVLKGFIRDRNIYPFVAHAGYVVNICSHLKSVRDNSIKLVQEDLKIACLLGANYYIIHFGSHPDKRTGLRFLCEGLKKITHLTSGLQILLENTAGEGNKLGAELEDLFWIANRIRGIGVCLDTAHLFSAGYDISKRNIVDEIFRRIEENIGEDKVRLIHLNDSCFPLGARRDRHDHIGEGYIGEQGFRNFLSHPEVRKIPLILETPKRNEKDDITNINRVKYLASRREV